MQVNRKACSVNVARLHQVLINIVMGLWWSSLITQSCNRGTLPTPYKHKEMHCYTAMILNAKLSQYNLSLQKNFRLVFNKNVKSLSINRW